MLKHQNEENAELNKNLPEQIEKLKETIKIHEAKPPRKDYHHEGGDKHHHGEG
jgi:hypothetical protein